MKEATQGEVSVAYRAGSTSLLYQMSALTESDFGMSVFHYSVGGGYQPRHCGMCYIR